MSKEKLHFLQETFIKQLRNLKTEEKGKWGKMNSQQMVEHVCDFFKVSTEKKHFALATPVEHLPQYKAFLLSEKEFRENTRAPVLPDEPFALRHPNMESALDELNAEITFFVEYFQAKPDRTTLHPAFGELNFEEWIQLHHKHVMHHSKQFGVWPTNSLE